jgi:hypothetical protein
MGQTITYTDKDGWNRHRKEVDTWFRETFYYEDKTENGYRVLTYVVTEAAIETGTRSEYKLLYDTVDLEYSTDLVKHEYKINEDGIINGNPHTTVQIIGRGRITHKFLGDKKTYVLMDKWIVKAKKYITPILKADIVKYHVKDYQYKDLWNIGRDWIDLDEDMEDKLSFP